MISRLAFQGQRRLPSGLLRCVPSVASGFCQGLVLSRPYAWTRQPSWRGRERPVSTRNRYGEIKPVPTESVADVEYNEAVKDLPLSGSEDAEVGLQRLLQNDTLVVVR